jgi:diketogulonate reductase-like aldo/keto reductase
VPQDSPLHASERLGSWVGLQQLKKEGLVRSLGVSNFEIKHLEHLQENSGVLPDVNQVELHPRYQQVRTVWPKLFNIMSNRSVLLRTKYIIPLTSRRTTAETVTDEQTRVPGYCESA